MNKYAPFTEDFWCQYQTLSPNTGIRIYSGYQEMAVGMQRLPLEQRYKSFTKRLSLALVSKAEPQPHQHKE